MSSIKASDPTMHEEVPLLSKPNATTLVPNPTHSLLRRSTMIIVATLAVALFGALLSASRTTSSESSTRLSSSSSSSSTTTFTGCGYASSGMCGSSNGDMCVCVETKYSRNGIAWPGTQYVWVDAPVVEPFKEIFLSLEGDSNPGVEHRWEIKRSDGSFVAAPVGSSVKFLFEDVGRYTVTVMPVDGRSESLAPSLPLIVKYVRRELTKLLKEDRDALLDAMYITYTVSTDKGQAKYGPSYSGADWFTEYHNRKAGAKDCDHMHDGLGFLNAHASLSLKYENVLRLINPSISLAYWDYTIQAQEVQKYGDIRKLTQSEIFTATYFGGAQSMSGRIPNGRFKDLKINDNAREFTNTYNAYGMLRAPWNMNKTPYVTRFPNVEGADLNTLPGCQEHYDVLQYQTFYDWGMQVQYLPHGLIHTVIGGVTNVDVSTTLQEAGLTEIEADSFAATAFVLQKNMWRFGFLECPTECSLDTEVNDCGCKCPLLDEWLKSGEYVTGLKQFLISEYMRSLTTTDEGKDISDVIFKVLCNVNGQTPVIGDMLESAAPADPIFWPTHPTIERLYMWWRMLQPDANMYWVDDAATTVEGVKTGYCEGHNSLDTFLWSSDGVETDYTNLGLLDMFDPNHDVLNYVYDSFTWDHCVSSGFDRFLSSYSG